MPSPSQLVEFGIALRKARERAGLAQRALGAAVAAGEGLDEPITGAAVGLWERGAAEPGRDRIAVIENVLGLRAGTLTARLGYTPLGGEVEAVDLRSIAARMEQLSEAVAELATEMRTIAGSQQSPPAPRR